MQVVVFATGNAYMERAHVAAGHQVYLVAPPDALASQQTEGLAGTRPIRDWDDYNELDELARALPEIDGVATMDEQAIRAAGFLADRLGLPGYSFRTAVAGSDKLVMKLRLAAAGVPVARHHLARDLDDVARAAADLGYPVVVKPRSGMGAVHTFFVHSDGHLAELEAAGRFRTAAADSSGRFTASNLMAPLAGRPEGFLVEEGLKVLSEYWCDLLVHDGRVVLPLPGRYSNPLLTWAGEPAGQEYNLTLLSPQEADPGIVDLSARAVAAIGPFSGHAHCEVLQTPSGLVFGEIALRRGGAAIPRMIDAMYGFEIDALDAQLALGQPPPTDMPPPRYQAVAAIYLTPQPGIVRSVDGLDAVRSHPGVLSVNVGLTPGQRTPGWFTVTTPLAGHILYGISDPARIDEEIREVRNLVRITVDEDGRPPAASAAGYSPRCVR